MTTNAWHIVSSPVSGQKIDNFLAMNPNVAADDGSGVRAMMDYNPVVNDWNKYFIDGANGDNELETGKGFSMRTYADIEVTFSGTLQTGNQSATGLIPEKWNCIGNPYTSAIGINAKSISTDDFLNANAIVSQNLDPSYGAIYVWDNGDEFNGVWGKYTIISNTLGYGSEDAFDVQQGQAFMVKMNIGKTSVSYNSGMQIHEPGLGLKSTNGVWPSIKLEVDANMMTSSTLIAFNNSMTKGLDPTYDAGLLKGGADLAIYSRLVEDNGVSFAIQALPLNGFKSMIVPIGLDFKTGGKVLFSSQSINLPMDYQVILEDKFSKTFTDLSSNRYETEIAANSITTDRFQLHISSQTTGANINQISDDLSAYAIRNVEIRVNGQVSSHAIATLYDIQGRVILVKNMEEGSLNVLKTPNIKTGIYMLFVKDNNKVQSFKIPVKE